MNNTSWPPWADPTFPGFNKEQLERIKGWSDGDAEQMTGFIQGRVQTAFMQGIMYGVKMMTESNVADEIEKALQAVKEDTDYE